MSQKILLLEGIHQVAKEKLESYGWQVDLEPKALPQDELISRIGEYSAIGIRSKTRLTEEVLEAGKNLLAAGTFCIGTNQVKLDFAKNKGIPVFNAPYSNTRSVAELVISEMIALSRKMADRSAKAHQGIWEKSAAGSHEVRGKTLGIIGYGHIGSQLSILAEALGIKVLYFDVVKKLPLGNASSVASMNELLGQCDFVSLHVPETPETKNMIKAEQLNSMKKGSHLINASRGTVVQIDDLKKAIESGHIAGAAVDVFPVEPGSNQEEFSSPLQGLPNVILTPHIGGSTMEAQKSIGLEVSESLNKFLKYGSTSGAVNFPQIEAPINNDGVKRVLNIHSNRPGVLGEINSIVSDLGANIRRQYLSTSSEVGYLIMDMELEDATAVAKKIKELSTSIRTRVV